MFKIVASLADNPRSIIYNSKMFIVQPLDLLVYIMQ